MISSKLIFGFLAALIFSVGLCARAQAPKGKPAPDEMTGPSIGTKAPAFTLADQDGKDRSLEEFVKHGKVAVVFYRSADW
jgi:cytochrome oxidase Cu insertion factor (SCO1/SenC/PrrC family)